MFFIFIQKCTGNKRTFRTRRERVRIAVLEVDGQHVSAGGIINFQARRSIDNIGGQGLRHYSCPIGSSKREKGRRKDKRGCERNEFHGEEQ